MRVLAVDTETAPIIPGLLAPPVACLSWAEGSEAGLVDRANIAVWMLQRLHAAIRGKLLIVGHNFAYDAVVLAAHAPALLPVLFEAYQAGGIVDTMICEQLFDIARGDLVAHGRYSLDALAKHYLKRELDKSTWRMRYGTLISTPIDQWPAGAKAYAIDDARATLDVFREQLAIDDEDWLYNAPAQAKYAFSMQLMCVWGIRTAKEPVFTFAARLEEQQETLARTLLDAGLLRHEKKKGEIVLVKSQKLVREIVTAAYNGEPPTTDKGGVSCDRSTLTATGDKRLEAYAEYVANEKLLSTYIPVLKEGTEHPINASFRMVESGRRGATKNMQTPPKAPGVRECHVPRPGYVFCSCDYDSLEFRALGQVNQDLFGQSVIVDMYREDPNADPHTKLAAEMFLGISYEEGLARKKAKDPELLKFRQNSKAYNFGLPGGLGAAKFVSVAAEQYGVELTQQEAEANKAKWIKTWRLQPFFDYVGFHAGQSGSFTQPRSRRVRGGMGFCDLANNTFQSPAADGACEAHFQVAWACYVQPESLLYGCRIVNFLHDELILEIPEWKASAAAKELSRIMNEAMMLFTPDVPITTSPALMRCWSKKADSIYDSGGNLLVWEPSN